MFSVFCSCNEASGPRQDMEKKVGELERVIQETDDCDELQLMSFSILGLMTDLENMQQDGSVKENDLSAMNDMITGLEATLNGKITALGCNQAPADGEAIDIFGGDEDEE